MTDTLRYSFLPINHQNLHAFYKKHKEHIWLPTAIDFSKDPGHNAEMPKSVRHINKFIVAFFSQIDGLVIENIDDLQKDTSYIKEASHFYSVQNFMETIHNETYSLMIDALIQDPIKRYKVLDAIKNYPCIKTIYDFNLKWRDPVNRCVAERIVANSCLEGIIFSGAFGFIYWLKDEYKDKMRGFTKANEWISIDEMLHTYWGPELYKVLVYVLKHEKELSRERIMEIITEAVEVAESFIYSIFNIKGVTIHPELGIMTAENLIKYVKCAADGLMELYGCPTVYHEDNPFPSAIMLGLENKTNFFEDTVTEYQKCSETDWTFDTVAVY